MESPENDEFWKTVDKAFEEEEKWLILQSIKDSSQNCPLRRKLNSQVVLLKVKREVVIFNKLQKVKRLVGLKKDMHELDLLVARSINKKFNTMVQYWPKKVKIWDEYIRFSDSFNFLSSTRTQIIDLMLEMNRDDPNFFKLAAGWELQRSIDTARQYLLKGIEIHPTSRMLYLEAFRLELDNVELHRNESAEEDGCQNHDTEAVGRALDLYNLAVTRIKDVEFTRKFLKLAIKHDFCSELEQAISKDLSVFNCSEVDWDIRAKSCLRGHRPLKVELTQCVEVYQDAVKQCNTSEMWKLYLGTMISLSSNNDSIPFPNLRKNMLFTALKQAHKSGMATEEHYLKTAEIMKDVAVAEKILSMGLSQLNQSVELWSARLTCHLRNGSRLNGMQVLEEATKELQDKAAPLWKNMAMFIMVTEPAEVQGFFEKNIHNEAQFKDIRNLLKPLLMDWVALNSGISEVRRLYESYSNGKPYCLELHTKLYELEDLQPERNIEMMRKCLQNATQQFGDTSIKVWLDYMDFEQTKGIKSRVMEVYHQARIKLDKDLIKEFIKLSERLTPESNSSENRH